MHIIDVAIVTLYVTTVLWIGRRFSYRQRTVRDYFLTGQSVPWWAVMASIVATETSTITLISVPGYAFGGDVTFLQIAFGYIAGRSFVALVLIPPYFRGDILTAYQLITTRFGQTLGRAAATIFLVTRNVSDGLRLFATGIVLATVLASATATAPLPADGDLIILSVCVLAAVTLTYTWLGGMAAVVWMDLVQLVLYLTGAIVAVLLLVVAIPGGLPAAWTVISDAGKLTLFDLTADLTRDYTFWSAVIGGAFFAAATHGTDQMFVQRYLCCRSAKDAKRALVTSGIVVAVQFALFLTIGLLLWVYYTESGPNALTSISTAGTVQLDQIFPHFIVAHYPVGLRGLMVAAIIAAAMSTLSSSLNSSASSVVGDFYLNQRSAPRSDLIVLRVSRMATIGCALAQIVVALVAVDLSQRIIDDALRVQFFTGGFMLGIFLLSVIGCTTHRSGVSGLTSGLLAVVLLSLLTDVSWQWYTLVGTLVTVSVGYLVHPGR